MIDGLNLHRRRLFEIVSLAVKRFVSSLLVLLPWTPTHDTRFEKIMVDSPAAPSRDQPAKAPGQHWYDDVLAQASLSAGESVRQDGQKSRSYVGLEGRRWDWALRASGAGSSSARRKGIESHNSICNLFRRCYGYLPRVVQYALEIFQVSLGSCVMLEPQALRESITNIMTIAALVAGFAVSVSMEVRTAHRGCSHLA